MKKSKFLLTFFVCLCSLSCAIGFAACSEPNNENEHKNESTPSNELSYQLSEDKTTYTVSGIGTYKDTDLVIPATYNNLPVTSIGSNSFRSNTSIVTVTIPESVTIISQYAFTKCTSLTSVTLPDGLITIGNGAFEDCTSLKSLTVPSSVNKISNRAFYGCTSLESVTIEEGVSIIDINAFHSCASLTKVSVPNSITSISGSSFYGCAIKFNEYDNGLYIGNSDNKYLALVKAASPSIKSCKINENTKFICSGAFSGCSLLTKFDIPDGITKIDGDTFSDCTSLTEISIPLSVTEIGSFTFENCSSLSTIQYAGTATQWDAVTKRDRWDYNAALFYVIFNG